MKVSIALTEKPEPVFVPVAVQIVCENQGEVDALYKFGWWTGTIRNALRKKAAERAATTGVTDRALNERESEHVRKMQQGLRERLRASAS